MTHFSDNFIIQAINYLIARESWASERLLPFAGQCARIQVPPIQLDLAVRSDGQFLAVQSAEQMPSVTIILPDDTPAKMVTGDQSAVFSAAKISGSAEFAEALAFVFLNLHWDAEADLAAVFGDIAAYRASLATQSFLSCQKSSLIKFLENIKESLSEESGHIVAQQEINVFSAHIETIRNDLARLEKRIDKIRI